MAHSYRHGDGIADNWQPDKGNNPPGRAGQELFHENTESALRHIHSQRRPI